MKPLTEAKICIVSHILPPSPSGQAMALSRLLASLPVETYCLVSRDKYRNPDSSPASTKLNAPSYELRQTTGIPLLQSIPSENFRIITHGISNIIDSSRQLLKIIKKENCRAIMACSGDPFDLPAAYLASRKVGIPLIPYIFDDFLYQWVGPYRLLARMFIGRIMKASAEVIVPNELLKADYETRYGVTATVIHNPCILPDFKELDTRPPVLSEQSINIVYTGSVYHAHYDAFRNLVKAIDATKRDDIRLIIFTSQREADLRSEGIDGPMISIRPHVPADEVPVILRQADILFLPLAFDTTIPEVIRTSAPGKTGEYLAAGRPILVHAPRDSFLSDYFSRNGCGMVVDVNDPAALSVALLRILNNKGLAEELNTKALFQAAKDFDLESVQQIFSDTVSKYLTGE